MEVRRAGPPELLRDAAERVRQRAGPPRARRVMGGTHTQLGARRALPGLERGVGSSVGWLDVELASIWFELTLSSDEIL